MRPFSALGIVLIVLGILALSIHSFTYFTTEQVVGPLGFFAWDVSRPHTIFLGPIVGIVAVGAGLALALIPGKRMAA